jgi:hypothetical protein
MKKRGFSVVELLLSLAFSLLVFISALEFFGLTRSLFLKLKKAEETNQSAMAALDKMRTDLLRAGFGLAEPIRHGTLDGLRLDDNSFEIVLRDAAHLLQDDISAGENEALLNSAPGLSSGREVCFADEEKSELALVTSCSRNTVVLSAPLEHSYSKGAGRMLVLEKITLFHDEQSGAIRRKVNTSSPQPLLDDVFQFVCAYDADRKLACLSFILKEDEEKRYEISVFPKNLGLALPNL